MLVYLQSTSPLRRANNIDQAIGQLLASNADSVVSVVPVPHQFNPVSFMHLDDGLLKLYLSQEAQPLRRQDKPELWTHNGPAVLATARATLMDLGVPYGPRTLPF